MTAAIAPSVSARKLAMVQTIGFNPEMFTRRDMLLQLVRLVAFCERNYNPIELGPKGTGKSHILSEFSPH